MSQVPAGWYADPSSEEPGGPTERYWDGFSWSHQVRPSQPSDTAVPGGQYPDRPYKAPSIPSTPDGQVLASWWIRAGATVGDWIIMIPLLALVAVPSLASHWGSVSAWWQHGYGGRGNLVTEGAAPNPPVLDPSTGPGLALYASLFATSVAYTLIFLRWKQATPGKLLAGVQIRKRAAPGPLGWSTILRRVGFTALLAGVAQLPTLGVVFLIVAVLDYLWPLWDKNRQTLHDKVAGTNVVLNSQQPNDRPVLPPPAETEFKSIATSSLARTNPGSNEF